MRTGDAAPRVVQRERPKQFDVEVEDIAQRESLFSNQGRSLCGGNLKVDKLRHVLHSVGLNGRHFGEGKLISLHSLLGRLLPTPLLHIVNFRLVHRLLLQSVLGFCVLCALRQHTHKLVKHPHSIYFSAFSCPCHARL